MGQDFAEAFPYAKDVFAEASEAIQENLEEICFTENDRINLTEFTQPAILTTEIAILRVMERELGLKGNYFAGHSLGEYSALVASGVMDLTSAVQIVRKRGALMQEAVPEGVGAMSALILPDIQSTNFKEIIDSTGAEVANFNSKDQVVISGKKESVESSNRLLGEKFPEMNIVPLTVSAPFHSSLMKVIEPEFKSFLSEFPIQKEKCTSVLSNFTGDFHTPDQLIENLTSQISGSVDWVENMKKIISKNQPIIELGPNRPLGKFFQSLGVDVPSVINVRAMKKLNLGENL